LQRSLTFGSTRLDLVLDAYWDADGNAIFHPARQKEWGAGITAEPNGKVPVLVSALLISEGSRHTLVDTGFGEGWLPKRQESVLKGLAQLGVQPKEISRVILTHAHADHVMGNTLKRGRRWIPAYPVAEYVVQEAEVAAVRAAEDKLWQTRFAPLAERGQLRLLNGRTELSDTLSCWLTPGHTIGHQSVLIHAPGQEVLFLGDLAVLAKNMERLEWGHSWAWSLEADVSSRREVNEWAISHDAFLIIGHDPDRPWVKIERAADGYRAVPLSFPAES